jgi:hypothetical protein
MTQNKFHTPIAEAVAPLERMRAIALANGWREQAYAIGRVIWEVRNNTF